MSWPLATRFLDEETLDHVRSLERGFAGRTLQGEAFGRGAFGAGAFDSRGTPDFDVALAGGGLSLIYGAYLARAGLRVCVLDRRRIGCGHREWNVSRPELDPLARSGLFTVEEADALVTWRYDRGVVRWHGGGTYPVRGVLDCAIDAQGLLDRLRALAAGAGATLLDGHALTGYRLGRAGVALDLAAADGAKTITARLLVDGTGAASRHAAFDLACPTVGGVLTGLAAGDAPDEVDPRVGEILASTEHVEDGRQHLWEAFPGAGGRTTVYLFYYAEPASLGEHPLLDLYERFFAQLARYKRGEARLVKPTYGVIPAYSRLRPAPAAPADRVILVGDAAGRHSPLTFCGFGATLRSFLPVADALRARLAEDRLDRAALARAWSEPPSLAVMGGLTLMMVPRGSRKGEADAVNRLLDAAFASLAELGDEPFAAFLRDEIGARDFIRFMRMTARRRPSVYREAFQLLTPTEIAAWSWRLLTLAATRWR